MKEKERGKNETEKKGVKKKFQCGNQTRDLLICKHCVAIVSPCMRIYNQTLRITIYIYIYIANLDFDDLTVAALAVLAPPTTDSCYIMQVWLSTTHCCKYLSGGSSTQLLSSGRSTSLSMPDHSNSPTRSSMSTWQ